MTDVSVIVVNWNTRELLRQCLASIHEGLASGQTAEIWVVDNASSDGSAAMVQADFPQVRLIANEENVGFARANNQALRLAEGRCLLLLNSDCHVLPNAIGDLIHFLDEHSAAGAAGCRLLNGDGSLQRSAWHEYPTLAALTVSGLWLDKLPIVRGRLAREEHALAQATEPVRVAHLLGACLMVRRSVLEAVGPLDDAFFMYLEETDWCRRIEAAGWTIWYLPRPEIIHYGQQSAALAPDKATADWCRSMCRFYRQSYAPARREMAAVKAVISASVTLRFLVAQVRKRGLSRPTWRGTAGTLRALWHA